MQIRARNVYSQSLENQQVNLIARAKLGSHFRSRRVQFFNSLGIIKNKLWDRRIVWWFCSQIFFAHFGASFASSSASVTPKGDPDLAPDYAHYAPTFATKIWLQNHQTILWSHNLFLMISKLLKNWTDRDLNLALAMRFICWFFKLWL